MDVVVGAIPRKYGWLYIIKHKNDMQPPSYITSEALGHLVYMI